MAAAEQFLPYLFSAMCLVGGISLILYPLIFLSLNESNTELYQEDPNNINFGDLFEYVTFWQSRKSPGKVTEIVDLKQQTTASSVEQRPTALISGKEHSVLDKYLTASASHYADHGPRCSRLGAVKPDRCLSWGWAGKRHFPKWIQVDLSYVHVIVAIHTKGRSLYDTVIRHQWVTRFMIETSDTGEDNTFIPYTERGVSKKFVGNFDSDTLKVNRFEPPLLARFVRLSVLRYKHHPTLRWELYGFKKEK